MALKYCRNGHEYDDAIHSSCPHCAAMPNRTVPMYGADMNAPAAGQNYGATAPVLDGGMGYADPMAGYGPTAPMGGTFPGGIGADPYAPAGGSGTVGFSDPFGPAGNDPYSPFTPGPGPTVGHFRDTEAVNPLNSEQFVDPDQFKTGAWEPEKNKYPKTQEVNYKNKAGAQSLVTGWLVCIDGAEKGKDYRLHENFNKIGRDPGKNDVVITKDPTISREQHAIIAYDSASNQFFIAPNFGSSIIYVNGTLVMNNAVLSYGDKIKIGESTFLFVPLCGEKFKW